MSLRERAIALVLETIRENATTADELRTVNTAAMRDSVSLASPEIYASYRDAAALYSRAADLWQLLAEGIDAIPLFDQLEREMPVAAGAAASEDPERAKFIDGLRAMCDWLEANPDSPAPYSHAINIPLHTNAATETWADEHGARDLIQYDDEGNASLDFMFGSVAMHVYGYTNFADHLKHHAKRRAQEFAAAHGLALVAADEQAAAGTEETVTGVTV